MANSIFSSFSKDCFSTVKGIADKHTQTKRKKPHSFLGKNANL
jgi:hypothetical protein